MVVAEVEHEELLASAAEIERNSRSSSRAGRGDSYDFPEAAEWIVKSTAGKAARSATREKLCASIPNLGLILG